MMTVNCIPGYRTLRDESAYNATCQANGVFDIDRPCYGM